DLRTCRAANEAGREKERPEPADHRHAGDEPETPDFPFARLAPQLEAEPALGACVLGLQLLALELEARRVAIECFLQRRNDDSGETCFEMTQSTAAWRELLRRGVELRSGPAAAAARQIRDADQDVEDAEPGQTRHRSIMSRPRPPYVARSEQGSRVLVSASTRATRRGTVFVRARVCHPTIRSTR